jgi:hypothetical protein
MQYFGWCTNLAGERAIRIAIFVLLLVGLCGMSGWIIYGAADNILLSIAGIALSWGIILLVLYVGFRALKWEWWK